jgi:hypothetical protein
MGQSTTRVAIQTAIENAVLAGTIPLVGTVYPSRAYVFEQDYEKNAALAYTSSINGSGCVIVVNLPGPDKRTRLTLVGRGAVDDMNVHPVVLELFFASKGGGLTSGDPMVNAQKDYDSVVDGLVPYIRNNPTMSAPGVVWSAGEYKAGVVHSQSSPFTDAEGLTTFIVGTVRFESYEQIIGTGV